MLLRQSVGMAYGFCVAGVYRLTRGASGLDNKSMMATLVLLTLMISVIASVIGDNIARAFSLVGALSIVRFRTVVEDTRDTAFVILAVGCGLAIGSGFPLVPIVLIPASAIASLAFAEYGSERYSATIRTSLALPEAQLVARLSELCHTVKPTRTSTSRQGTAIDLEFALRLKRGVTPRTLVDTLSAEDGITSVDVAIDRPR